MKISIETESAPGTRRPWEICPECHVRAIGIKEKEGDRNYFLKCPDCGKTWDPPPEGTYTTTDPDRPTSTDPLSYEDLIDSLNYVIDQAFYKATRRSR